MTTFSGGTGLIYFSTNAPGLSESPAFPGNFWLRTTTGNLYMCKDNTPGAQVWDEYPIATVTVDKGGTGATTLTGLVVGNGTSAFTTTTYVDNSTFTPAINFGGGTTGITYSLQRGHYSQLGNRVFFSFVIVLTSKGSDTGNLQVTGFPVATGTQGNDNACSTLLVGVTFPANSIDTFLIMDNSATTGLVYDTDSTGNLNNITDANCTNTTQIYCTGQYFIN